MNDGIVPIWIWEIDMAMLVYCEIPLSGPRDGIPESGKNEKELVVGCRGWLSIS